MDRSPWVVIPTYWTWPLASAARPESGSFDHPTPVDGESTLPGLLDDLCRQTRGDFHLLVLAGIAHPALEAKASVRAHQLLRAFQGRLRYLIMDAARLSRLLAALRRASLPAVGLGLDTYAGIRNLQLLVPHLFGAEAVVALDDDERVEADYLARALSRVGRKVEGADVLGLAGPYRQPEGGVLLPTAEPTGNVFLDKAIYINQAMSELMAGGEALRPSPLTLGGNMVFHPSLVQSTPFDPGITRGEDIDYLINARIGGMNWWFDPGLSILHLPPHRYDSPPYKRLREDVIRFLYERQKLSASGWEQPEWLEPYPGRMLGPDLEEQARQALERVGSPAAWDAYGDPDSIVDAATAHARRLVPQFAGFAEGWRRMMVRIEREEDLRTMLAAALTEDGASPP